MSGGSQSAAETKDGIRQLLGEPAASPAVWEDPQKMGAPPISADIHKQKPGQRRDEDDRWM